MAWQGVEGHDVVVQVFRQSLERRRLAHAYLFAGPAGIGKRQFARALARTLMCETRNEAAMDPCGTCPGCKQVTAGTHPDLIAVRRPPDKTDLPIDMIRDEVLRGLSLKPDRGRYKIAILDDADDMNHTTANCLLKTLEEPPPRSVIILIVTSPARQLATIVSRCQVIRFRGLLRETTVRLLEQTGIARDRDQAEYLAEASGGSLERAGALADPAVLDFRGTLWQLLAADRFDGVGAARQIIELSEAAGSASVDRRIRAQLLLGLCIDFFRLALREAAGVVSPVRLSNAEQRLVQGFANSRSADAIVRLVDRTLRADAEIDRMALLAVVIEAWADSMARIGAVR